MQGTVRSTPDERCPQLPTRGPAARTKKKYAVLEGGTFGTLTHSCPVVPCWQLLLKLGLIDPTSWYDVAALCVCQQNFDASVGSVNPAIPETSSITPYPGFPGH
jgi:hypothetical protein